MIARLLTVCVCFFHICPFAESQALTEAAAGAFFCGFLVFCHLCFLFWLPSGFYCGWVRQKNWGGFVRH